MMDELQQAYNAYQTALGHLPNPRVRFPHPAHYEKRANWVAIGPPALVWDRYPL